MTNHEPKVEILLSLAQLQRYLDVYVPHLDTANNEIAKIEAQLEKL